jgi:hypothetical protein
MKTRKSCSMILYSYSIAIGITSLLFSTVANAVPIINGSYFKSPPDNYWGIEVQNKRFRVITEGSDPTDPVAPWQNISKLKPIKKGVVLYEKTYLCSLNLYPNNKYCIRNGGKERHS